MVDASEFIPEHHFVKANTIDGFHSIRPRPRSSVAHIKYYFIDFGLSVRYPPGKIPIAMGKVGQERDVPEFKDEYQPYDPFKLDVYQLGTTIAKDVVAVSMFRNTSVTQMLIDHLCSALHWTGLSVSTN